MTDPRFEGGLTMAHVTFGMLGSVIFDMTLAGGPVPPEVHSPRVESFVTITCTEEQARAMERWLRAPEQESPRPAPRKLRHGDSEHWA